MTKSILFFRRKCMIWHSLIVRHTYMRVFTHVRHGQNAFTQSRVELTQFCC